MNRGLSGWIVESDALFVNPFFDHPFFDADGVYYFEHGGDAVFAQIFLGFAKKFFFFFVTLFTAVRRDFIEKGAASRAVGQGHECFSLALQTPLGAVGNGFGVSPQLLQTVIVARRRTEDMHNNTAEIQKHPGFAALAFGMNDPCAELRHRFPHPVGQSLHVHMTIAGGDDKEIGECRKVGEIKNDNFFAFYFGEGFRRSLRLFLGIDIVGKNSGFSYAFIP